MISTDYFLPLENYLEMSVIEECIIHNLTLENVKEHGQSAETSSMTLQFDHDTIAIFFS